MSSQNASKYIEAMYFFPTILLNTSWINFIYIFSALLTENSVCFVSKNRKLVSHYISFFLSLLKPYVWEFPIIYFLDKKNYDYLNSPVPLIVGVDSSSEEFKFKIKTSDISNKFICYYIEDDTMEITGKEVPLPKFAD